MARRSVHSLRSMKQRGERFAMITCYDYPSAKLAEAAGFPAVLVGDSLGTTLLGYGSTLRVTMEDMLHHARPVARATDRAIVVVDLPFGAFQTGPDDALRNAVRLMQEGRATAVKLEGGQRLAPTVDKLVGAGIPVMGHVGLTPQSLRQLGGYRVQGKDAGSAQQILADAEALQAAGVFAVVLECIPAELARRITERLAVPTIGIGAGPHCDGQIQVWHDLLGLDPAFLPRHTRRYADLAEQIAAALKAYREDVERGAFPTLDHAWTMDPAEDLELDESLRAPGRAQG